MNLHNILCLLLILVDVRLGPMNFQYRFDSPQGIHTSVLTVLVTTSFPFCLHIICINISIITGMYWPYQASDPATTSINVETHHVLSPCPLEKKRIESIIISVFAMLSEWVSLQDYAKMCDFLLLLQLQELLLLFLYVSLIWTTHSCVATIVNVQYNNDRFWHLSYF